MMPERSRRDRSACGAIAAIVCLVAALAASGCQPGRKGPATAPVTGVVTFNGDPVAGATVGFQPNEGGRSAAGVTDASGRYQLSTYARNDGAIPGDYKVVIVKYDATPTGSGTGKDYRPPVGDVAPPKNELPAKYANGATSGLKATVVTGQNSIDFPLTP